MALDLTALAADHEPWLREALQELVDVSSPSGDHEGAEQVLALCVERLPPGCEVERLPCSTESCAPDLAATLRGSGSRRVLLLGHVDTVFSHAEHQPLREDGDRLHGSGTSEMKGGVVISLAVL